MEERSLRIVGADKTFFGRLTNTLTKMIMPTKMGINGIIISIKRNAMLKAYSNLSEIGENSDKEEALTQKYDGTYASYLETIDKHVMDTIYKKVKNRTASLFEENALAKYYTVVNLKETQHTEYKYRKQKYLIELDYEGLEAGKNEKLLKKYKKFYYKTMEGIYKGILKTYSVNLANSVNEDSSVKEVIYKKIFDTIEEYLEKVLPLKIEFEPDIDKEIINEYDKFATFRAGKLEKKETIEKQIVVLGISRKLFTHSLPLVVAEQCYKKLIKNVRDLIITSPNKKKEDMAYNMLIGLIEEFNIKLLSTKIYWDNTEERQKFKNFLDEYKALEHNKNYETEKQALILKYELKELNVEPQKNEKIIAFYRNKLTDFGKIRKITNACKTENRTLMKPKAYEKYLESQNVKTTTKSKSRTKTAKKVKTEVIEEVKEDKPELEIIEEIKEKKKPGRKKKVAETSTTTPELDKEAKTAKTVKTEKASATEKKKTTRAKKTTV